MNPDTEPCTHCDTIATGSIAARIELLKEALDDATDDLGTEDARDLLAAIASHAAAMAEAIPAPHDAVTCKGCPDCLLGF